MSLFMAQALVKRFGGLLATDHVDLSVAAGEIHALIGPNGAGKSTLVNLISGLLPVDGGRILLDGADLTRLAPHQRVRRGLARCFQISSVFRNDTVRDNLLLAVQAQAGSSFAFLRRRAAETALQDAAQALAEKVGLADVFDRRAAALPHGMQKRLDVALALAARPRLLLLDEPMAGMGPEDSQQMMALIGRLRADSAILLIEHDMEAVFRLADRISVLVHGRVLTTGDASHVKAHPQVQAVYLGSDAAEAQA